MFERIKTTGRLVSRLLHPYPVMGSKDVISCQPIFILSSGRSGSTLLRAILMQDPSVCIPPESHVLQQVCSMFRRYYRYLPWEYVVRLVVADFASAPGNPKPGFAYWQIDLSEFYHRAYALAAAERRLDRLIDLFYSYYREQKKPTATRWGDKSIENGYAFPELLRVFPQAQYIHLIRDGRDVVASLLQNTISNDLTKACEHWRQTNMLAYRLGLTMPGNQFYMIHYRDLVREPEKTVQSLCEFLGLTYTPGLLQFWQHSKNLGDTDRALHVRLHQPIDDRAIGRWKERLDAKEQRLVDRLLATSLRSFGYE